MTNNIPNEIGGANPICYLILESKHIKTGNTEHWVGGQPIKEIYGLSICKYESDNGYYLFYCDKNWETITDTYHDTVEDAKDQAEFEFANTIDSWTDAKSL
jgi:hypothetical protein